MSHFLNIYCELNISNQKNSSQGEVYREVFYLNLFKIKNLVLKPICNFVD